MTLATTIPALKRSSTLPALAFVFLVIVTLSLFLIPAVIIRPFAYQAPNALKAAMAIRSEAPLWTALTALFAIVLACFLWKRIATWAKVLVVLGSMLACAAAAMARIDYFEWMFHPVPSAGFEPASATKLDASQMVMAVHVNADSRAYPIRAMAYHHIVNDIVGGIPIAVTY